MHYIRISRVGKTACAVVLSCLLAAGPLMDSAPFYAFADEGTADVPATESDPARETAPEEKPQKHEQVNEDKPLAPDATQNQAPADKKPIEEGAANALPEGEAEASADGAAADVPSSPTVVNPDRVGVDVPLAQGEEVVATAGTVIVDGLSYVVNSDGGTATVAGCVDASAPKGDVIVAATVFSGSDEYLVTAVADEAFKDCEGIETIVLPDTLEAFGKDVFKGCSALQRIEVGERSKLHAVHDGMLFDKELSTLLVCPEGKQLVASLPDSMTSFADDAFAGCRNLEAFQVEEGNQTFASVDGVLYSADRTRLVMAPARTVSVIVAPETSVIAAGAFSACSGLASIIANGHVETIEGKAFSLETLSKAMVALASGDDYDARKAVWDEAGFTNYIEPAVPGEIQQPAPTQSGFVYELLDDYTLAVSWTGENDPEADLVIPTTAKLDGVEYRVSAIAPAGFQGRQSLTSVQIRAPITAIGDDAFAGCTGLASVELSEGVSAIGAGAFSGTAVQRAVIPASVTSVGSRAFADCPDLSRIVTFSNAPSVAADAIAGCTGVAIYAPYNEAGEYSWNPGLVASGNHILPHGISLASDPLTLEVDETADLFEGGVCEVPEGCELTYSYAATPISVEAGQVTGKKLGTSEVTVALSLDGVELGRSVRVVEVVAGRPIAASAMLAETRSSPIEINPDDFWIKDFGDGFIYYLTIRTVDAYIKASSTTSLSGSISLPERQGYAGDRYNIKGVLDNGFQNCTNITAIAMEGARYLAIGSYAFAGCTSLESFTFAPTVTAIGDNAFNGCTKLKSIAIPEGVTSIDDGTFAGCTSLESVTIPSTVTSIGVDAFKGCKSLKSISIPASVASIGAGAFSDTGLATINIPSAVTSIGASAFAASASGMSLSSITVDASNPNYKSVDGVLYNKAGDTLVAFPQAKTGTFSIPNPVVTVADGSFAFSSLSAISIPSSVVTIRDNAFKGCGFASVALPSSVSYLGVGSFSQCNNLKEVLSLRGENDTFDVRNCFTSSPTVHCYSKKITSWSGSGAGTVKAFNATPSETSMALVVGQSASSLSVASDLLQSAAFGSNVSITWASSDASVATLSSASGTSTTVEGKRAGTANVTAQLKYGSQLLATGTCSIQVSQTYKVHFDGNGASETMEDQIFTYGTAQSLSTNRFTKEGHAFAGWSLNPEGAGTDYSDGQSVQDLTSDPNGTVTLYAKWTPNSYALTFDTAGGVPTTIDAQQVVFGSHAKAVADPAKTGHEFTGWLSDEPTPQTWDLSSDSSSPTMPARDVSLTAQWSINTYTVTFSSIGDNVPAITVNHGDTITAPVPPARDGFIFAGWYDDPNCVLSPHDFSVSVTQDITLYAKWDIDPNALIGTSFEAQTGDGSWFKYTVLTIDGVGKFGTVSVAKSDDEAKAPIGDIVVPQTVVKDGFTYTVASVGALGFAKCQGITTMKLPSTVTEIGSQAFSEDQSLLEFPEMPGVRSIGLDAFFKTTSLRDVVLPDSLESLGALAFEMSGIESVVVPASVKTVGFGPFGQCGGLKSLVVDEENTNFRAVNGALCTFDGKTMLDAGAGQSFAAGGYYEIPDGVEMVGMSAFKNLPWLIGIVLPESLKSMGPKVVDVNRNLQEVICLSSNVSIETTSFYRCPQPVRMYCPQSTVDVWKKTNLSDVTAFATGAPAKVTVPVNVPIKLAIDSSIPTDSAFSTAIQWENVDGSIATIEPAAVADGHTFTVAPQADAGSFTATAKLVYTGSDVPVELASSTVEVSITASAGELPTDGNTNDGRWELTDDGTLRIWCVREGAVIQDLGWTTWGPSQPSIFKNHWGPVREFVKSIVVEDSVDAVNMKFWFSTMENLKDISGVRVPNGVTNVACMFAGSGIEEVPDTFVLHDGITSLSSLFNECFYLKSLPRNFKIPVGAVNFKNMFTSCRSLIELPENFTLPTSIDSCKEMFAGCTSLEYLPANFRLPQTVKGGDGFNNMFLECKSLKELPEGLSMDGCDATVTILNGMFAKCSSLRTLPSGFRLPPSVKGTVSLFFECSSLASLPEGFSIPETVTDINTMFKGCTSLVSLPSTFTLPEFATAQTGKGVFYTDSPLPMYYAGTNGAVTNYSWANDNRTFTKLSDKPADAKSIVFNIKAQGETGEGITWSTLFTNADGMLAEPGVTPTWPGYVFTLWYTDEACTQRADFTKPFTEDATLYGVMAPGTLGGTLPTVEGTGDAWWTLTDGGMLSLRGSGQVALKFPNNVNEEGGDAAWGLYRDQVKKIAMSAGFAIDRNMHCWFKDMANLVDLTDMQIPTGAVSLHQLFMGCTSLKNIPDCISIPDEVENTSSMFYGCSSLVSLPPSMVFSKTSKNANVSYMFTDCLSLATLPEGFFIPDSTVWMSGMFSNCPSLTSLPSSFSFPAKPQQNESAFYVPLAEGEPRVATYYSGSDPSVLEYDWKSQNRILVEDPADRSSYKVDFKLQNATPSEDGTFAWANRTTIVTNEKGIVANPGTPQLEGYSFTGWCTDEDCLEPFDFNTELEADTTLYGKWIVAGGDLPMVDNIGRATWTLTVDGALAIREVQDGTIADLGWGTSTTSGYPTEGYWSPWRSSIVKVTMGIGLSSHNANRWFDGMSNLSDVSKFYVPEGATELSGTFDKCSSLRALPEDFTIPEGVWSMSSTFRYCSLESLPSSFRLPETLIGASSLFAGKTTGYNSFSSLPDGFTLPEGLKNMQYMFSYCPNLTSLPESCVLQDSENLTVNVGKMFRNCSSLRSLPANFTIPNSVQSADSMFDGCSALQSLPEGFSIPQSFLGEKVDNGRSKMDYMFANCDSLTVFPDSFDFPLAVAESSTDPFKCTVLTDTYYNGTSASVTDYSKWASQQRNIISTTPAGRHLVSLMLPSADGAYGDTWSTVLSDIDDKLTEPVPEQRAGQLFLGWFVDAECTTAFNFAETVTSQLTAEPYTLYAKYETTSGDLPTTDGLYSASWSLSSDGTLAIRPDVPGAEILPLWDTPESGNGDDWPRSTYWSPFRDQVKRVVMEPGIKLAADPDAASDSVNAEPNMRYWFAGMPALEDISKVYVPEGVVSIARLFQNCGALTSIPDDFVLPSSLIEMSNAFHLTGLTSLPSGFVIPENVESMYTAFSKTQLKTLPDGFSLPASVKHAGWLFSSCTLLESIPESFVLNDGLEDAQCMFQSCKSLRSLPSRFTIPGSVTNAQAMFYECMELQSLPEGFRFEDVSKISDARQMFNACPKLVSLPSTLDLSGLSSEKGFNELLFGARGYTPDAPLTTFCAGGDLSKLAPASVTNDPAGYWKANFSRDLVSSEEGLPDGVNAVSFKLQAPGASDFTTSQTLLTDATGMLADPGAPVRFGYAFSGWCTSQECTASTKFDFAKSVTEQGLSEPYVLYGKYALITRVEVPVKATIPLSASGESQPVAVQMRSFTPVPLEVTSINSKEGLAADEVFPEAATRENLKLKLIPGLPPDTANAYELGLTGTVTPSGFDMAAAQNAASPGILDYSVGLVIPEGAKVGIRLYDFTTTIADLTYEVTARP